MYFFYRILPGFFYLFQAHPLFLSLVPVLAWLGLGVSRFSLRVTFLAIRTARWRVRRRRTNVPLSAIVPKCLDTSISPSSFYFSATQSSTFSPHVALIIGSIPRLLISILFGVS